MNLTDWIKLLGITRATLCRAVRNGKSHEAAIRHYLHMRKVLL